MDRHSWVSGVEPWGYFNSGCCDQAGVDWFFFLLPWETPRDKI